MTQDSTDKLEVRGSLARRMVAAALVSAVILLSFGAGGLTLLFRQTVFSDLDDRLAAVEGALLAHVQLEENGELRLEQPPTDPSYSRTLSGRYWQLGYGDGTGLLKSQSLAGEVLALDGLAASALADPGRLVVGRLEGPDGESLRVHVRALNFTGADGPLVFASAEDRAPADREVTRFATISAVVLIVFATLFAGAMYAQVRIGVGPVLRMGRAVAAVRDGDESRIAGRYPAELMPLANELNALLDHSKEVVDRARTHVGNLAHALKTPITVLTNEARTSDDALAELVSRQAEIMSDQVQHHLRRAQAAANAKAIGARTPVLEVMEGLGRTLRRIYAHRDITLEWSAPAELVFRGERQDLEDLVGNLMDNACKWAHGHVLVRADAVDDGRWWITVDDDGPGLSAKERHTAMGRGVRLDEQAPGTGLGLAIVGDLTKAYGGRFELNEAPLGGLRAKLILPGNQRRRSETTR